MRITQRAVALTSLQGLNRNLDAVGKLQQQLTSGRIINAPSDSPTGTTKAMQTRSEQSAVAQQARNISDAQGWLAQGDSTIREMLTTTGRVRDLTVQGLNSGAMSEAGRLALATEVASLRDGLISLANTTVQGRPVFGGTTTNAKAYDGNGTFVGVTAGPEITRRVSESEQVRVNFTGPEAFGPAGSNLFDVVAKINASLVSDDQVGLAAGLADLDTAIKRMTTAVADIGSRAARVDRAEQLNLDRSMNLRIKLGETENVDLPNAIMKLQMQQVGYEAALAATAKALSPTLLDYLH